MVFFRQSACISVEQQQAWLRAIDAISSSSSSARVSEASSPLMQFGRMFQKDHYAASQRTVIDGETLSAHVPSLRAFYYAQARDLVSNMLQCPVYPCEPCESVCLLALVYEQEGDVIDAHCDHAYFDPDQNVVTALLCLENRSSQRLCVPPDTAVIEAFEETSQCLTMRARDCFVFSHYDTLHRIGPPLRAGDRRVVVSMIFAERPRTVSVRDAVWESFKAFSVTGRMNRIVWTVRALSFLTASLLVVAVIVMIVLYRRGEAAC